MRFLFRRIFFPRTLIGSCWPVSKAALRRGWNCGHGEIALEAGCVDGARTLQGGGGGGFRKTSMLALTRPGG